MLPKFNLSSKSLSRARPAEDLEILPITIKSVMVDPDDGMIVVLQAEGKPMGFRVGGAEGALLSFALSGLSSNAHITTLPQLLLRFMTDQGTLLQSVVIEAKVGDIAYASLQFRDRRGKDFYAIVSVGDGLVMSAFSFANLGILRRVWEQVEEFDDWPYRESLGEYDLDDEEE